MNDPSLVRNMSSGYNTFTNQGYDVEGVPRDAPPNYQKAINETPTMAPPGYHQLYPGPSLPGQQTITHVTTGPVPNDYFGFALFVTICCCLPFGIVGLIKSSEVKNRVAVGDFAGAALSSSEARRWSKYGCIFGFVTWLIALVVMCVYVGLIYL